LHDSFGLFLLCLCMLLCHANKLLLLLPSLNIVGSFVFEMLQANRQPYRQTEDTEPMPTNIVGVGN